MAEQRPSLAGSGRCRQGRAPPRNSRQDNVRNRLLSAQRAFDARTLQRSRSLALGRRKSAALAARCRHERGSGSQSFGKRPPQSRRSPPHGLERHAKGWGKRLAPGQVQASRLGRTLPCPTPNPVLKCDRPGPRLLLTCGLALWSLAQLLGGLVQSFGQFFGARVLLGVGEAPQFPTGARVVRDWFNPRDRGLATGIFNCASSLGTAIAVPLLTWLMLSFGWRAMFAAMGIAGLLMAGVWFLNYRNPGDIALTSDETLYRTQGDPPGERTRVTWR